MSVLLDKFPDAGPLAGIERALVTTTSPLLLVLAVDLPDMSADFLRQLADHCTETTGTIPRISGAIEPLAAIYPRAAGALAVTLLEQNTKTVRRFAEQCVTAGLARLIDFAASEASLFANWNSPADICART